MRQLSLLSFDYFSEAELYELSEEEVNKYYKYALNYSRYVIRKYGISGVIDYYDLAQEGMIGLLDAASKFDRNKGEFDAYVKFRINGSIMDHVRRVMPYSPGMSKEYREQQDAMLNNEYSYVVDDSIVSDQVMMSNRMKVIEELLEGLSEREKKVIMEVFLDERKQTDVSEDMNLTPCRVSQIKKQALDKLREIAAEKDIDSREVI